MSSERHRPVRTVALEEHYATRAFLDGPGGTLTEHYPPAFIERLCDLDNGRIAEMDAAGVDVQVLSLAAPGVEQLDAADAKPLARTANDHLAAAVERHPTRFSGFAALPTPAPDAAADELERMVTDHGFVGGVINGHIGGRYLDDDSFWPILERAAGLDVPLYVHPTPPPASVIETLYTGNFSPAVSAALSTAGWGWHIDTAIHVLRIVLSGAFDRYPGLQLVIGHLGEGLASMLSRIEARFDPDLTGLERPIGAYFRENLHYSISGFNTVPTFQNLFSLVGADRIVFSADHPFASMATAREFLDRLPVSPAAADAIAYGNAERLLSV